MSEHNKDYKIEDITNIIERLRDCVRHGKYTISLNEKRKENQEFIETYNIRTSKQKEILEQITEYDFCYSMNSIRPGYESQILYLFAPTVSLFNDYDQEEKIQLYIKIRFTTQRSSENTIVISFHKANYPLPRLFVKI